MARRHTPAFILRTVDYGDHHVIVHLLGRDTGRISAIAYGARKSRRRFSGCLEPLRVVDATLTAQKSRDLDRLDELDVTEDFPGLEKRIETITAASYATELVRETWREGEEGAGIFELLRRCYRQLCDCADGLAIARLIHQFEFQLLSLAGQAPAVERCGRCKKAAQAMDKLRFSRRGEGLICRRCRRKNESVGVVADETLVVLEHLDDPSRPLPDTDLKPAVAQAGRVVENAIEQLVERPLTSRSMLLELI